MSTAVSLNRTVKKTKPGRATREKVKDEDLEILLTLEQLKKNLDTLHNSLDNITDPLLIDSCVYEMKALHMKYKYYLEQCKSRELAANIM